MDRTTKEDREKEDREKEDREKAAYKGLMSGFASTISKHHTNSDGIGTLGPTDVCPTQIDACNKQLIANTKDEKFAAETNNASPEHTYWEEGENVAPPNQDSSTSNATSTDNGDGDDENKPTKRRRSISPSKKA